MQITTYKTRFNEDSGNPEPSKADISATKLLVEAGDLLGISVLDHIIIGDPDYISLREHALM